MPRSPESPRGEHEGEIVKITLMDRTVTPDSREEIEVGSIEGKFENGKFKTHRVAVKGNFPKKEIPKIAQRLNIKEAVEVALAELSDYLSDNFNLDWVVDFGDDPTRWISGSSFRESGFTESANHYANFELHKLPTPSVEVLVTERKVKEERGKNPTIIIRASTERQEPAEPVVDARDQEIKQLKLALAEAEKLNRAYLAQARDNQREIAELKASLAKQKTSSAEIITKLEAALRKPGLFGGDLTKGVKTIVEKSKK